MKIQIQYCGVWNYGPRAAGLAAKIEKRLGVRAKLERRSGGVYEIIADGQTVYSKARTGVFPDESSLLRELQELVGG